MVVVCETLINNNKNVAHGTLINNNQPLGKNSIKNIRFCAVANCSSAYWSCALAGSDRSVRPRINKNTQKGVFVYSGWSARIGSVGCADTAPHSLALKLREACFRLLIVEPVTPKADDVSNQTGDPKAKIKPAKCRLNFWLERTDSNHDKENQNLLSYH